MLCYVLHFLNNGDNESDNEFYKFSYDNLRVNSTVHIQPWQVEMTVFVYASKL